MARIGKKMLIAEIGRAVQAYQRCTDAYDDRVADLLGLNRSDMRCLDVLFEGPASPSALAEATGITLSSTTTMLDRLQRRGFVRRVPDGADRRKVLVEMTQEGAETAARFYLPLAEEGGSLLAAFSLAELSAIRDFLVRSTRLTERHRRRLADPNRCDQAQQLKL